jgi:hypothetical protein
MRVSDIRVVEIEGGCQLEALVESDAHPDETDWFAPFALWYRFPAWCAPLLSAGNGDPFLAALLLPAMRVGERLRVEAPVSPRLLAAAPQILSIYEAFDPRAMRVPVEAGARTEPLPADGGPARVGLFFSMGVDSSYSLLKNLRDHPGDADTITHLISLHGIDVDHDGWSEAFPPQLLSNFERVARETGKILTPVVTNVRKVGARLAPWTMLHGGALASVALALGSGLSSVLVASSASYDAVYPWGTHPMLDPLWSTEGLTVVHDGCEADLAAKLAIVAGSPLVLETLRVCPGFGNGYNCGRCMKCMRTMVALLHIGVLDRCRTLPHEIDAEALRVALRGPGGRVHRANFQKRLDALVASGMRPDLQAVIAEHLATLDEQALARQEASRRPALRRLRDRLRLWHRE